MSLSVPLALTLLSELNGFKQNWERKKGSFSEIQATLSLARLVKVLAFPNSPHLSIGSQYDYKCSDMVMKRPDRVPKWSLQV